jgi:catechol 2,3-dioxygenase-like lactoylglutathione lyase family enzyme
MNSLVVPELGQVALAVRDVALAKRFYVDVLGLRPLFDAGPKLSFLGVGMVRLMLTVPDGAGEVGRNSVLYYRVAGLAEYYRRVVAAGAVPEREPQLAARLPDHELWLAFVRDPEGNLVGLMEERR